jgi:hypothetical protein
MASSTGNTGSHEGCFPSLSHHFDIEKCKFLMNCAGEVYFFESFLNWVKIEPNDEVI